MPRIHQTIAGHRVEYPDPSPKLEKFLERARELAADPQASEDDLIALVYGRENPLLDQTVFPERGAVTKEVLEDPTYQVLTDLLTRKTFQARGIDPEKVAGRYTMTVAEAAQQLGVHETAVRQAIKARRIPSWVKNQRHYLDPKTLGAIRVGSRGPLSPSVRPLSYRVGHDPASEALLRLRTESGEVETTRAPAAGRCEKWRRAVLLSGAPAGKLRLLVIEPSPEENAIENAGFFVRGNFKIVERENNPKRARERWEAAS